MREQESEADRLREARRRARLRDLGLTDEEIDEELGGSNGGDSGPAVGGTDFIDCDGISHRLLVESTKQRGVDKGASVSCVLSDECVSRSCRGPGYQRV